MNKKPRTVKDCESCGQEMSLPPCRASARFCSTACHGKAQRGARKSITCESCGNKFDGKKDHGVWQRFCSRECFKNQENGPKDAKCADCGGEFRSYWSVNTGQYQKYCSKPCHARSQKKRWAVPCANCGEDFEPEHWKLKENRSEYFCSIACHANVRCGSRSHAYKGGSYVVSDSGHRMIALGKHTKKAGFRAEHRIAVEKIIGRKLRYCSEPILHLNGNALDNRPENLYICTNNSEMGKILQGVLPFPERSNIDEHSRAAKTPGSG